MLTSEEKQLVKIEEYKNTINLEKCKIDQSLKKIAESLIEVKRLLPKSEWSSWLEMTEFVSKERKKSYGDAFNSYSSFFGGAGGNNKGVVSEEDKPTYKKLYRILAKNCHPDIIKDNGQTMKLVNELKEQWGI
ncbi:MAG: hypothetical protein KIC67_15640 [Clostridium butyricum]|nr:hypothetical protein [Clostridium butyricum]